MKPKLPYLLLAQLILTVTLCLPERAGSQNIQRVAPGEYATYNIDAAGRLWASGGNPALWGTGGMEGRQALPNLVQQQSGSPMPLFKGAYAGLDDAVAIDVSGNAWHIGGADLSAAGDGSTEPGTDIAHKYATRIFTDGSGFPFTGITMASQYWQSYTCKGWFAVKGTDSTLWIWGGDDLGAYSGTGVAQNYIPRPIQVLIPGNRKVVQIVSGTFAIARCSDGTVWTWGGGNGCDDYYGALGNGCTGTSYKYPKQVIGISNAKWVDGGRDRAFAICGGDSVFAWGRRFYIGIGSNNNNPEVVPLYVTPIWNLPHGVTKIVSNVNASHLILSDSTLWAFGSSPQGEVGNGAAMDRNAAPYPDWWSWDYATFTPFVLSPVQLVPGRHDFINSYGAMPYTYWFFDECVNGQLYFNGRNKGAIGNNGVINSDTSSGSMASYYDNAWDVATSIPVNPFSLRSPILVPAEPCVVNNSNTGCGGYTPPPVLPPTVNAGADKTGVGTTVTLTATSIPAPGRKVASYVWQQVSGPGVAYFSTFNDSTVTVSRLVPGTYVFRITATDHLNSKAYDDIMVTSSGSTGSAGGIHVGEGEFTTFFIDNNGTLTAIGNRGYSGVGGNTGSAGASGLPEPVVVSPANLKFKYAAGHFHGGAAVDENGRVWTMGATAGGESGMGNTDYSQYPQKILTDIDGNQFDSVLTVIPYSQSSEEGSDRHGWMAVKSSGTLWVWGTPGAMRGNGTEDIDGRVLRPARIIIPGGRSVQQVTGGDYIMALCTDGTVWTWGNTYRANLGYIPAGMEYASPHQINLSGITQIAGGKGFNYGLKNNGNLYGWGLLGNYMNDLTWPDGTGAEITFPQLLPNIQQYLPHPISKIITNFSITSALLTDGSLWTWGDNTQGCIGNGQSYYGNATNGYTWDYNLHLLQKIPYNVAPTRTFKNVFGGNLLTFTTYALGTDDQLYAWGTNKGSTIANRIDMPISGNVGAYDNAWNRPWPQPVDPFNITSTFISTSPVCLTDPGYPCNTYPIPANVKPTANAGPNQSVSGTSATLDGRGSTDNVFISYYIWSQVSGPNTAIMDLPASPTPRISGLITGTYVFKLVTIDNGWLSDSATVQVAVNAAGNQPPVANAGANQIIILPITVAVLSGSGNDPDGTIASYAWSQVSGTPATILTPSTASTIIIGLTTGVKVFRLTVTDNQGATGTSDVTITVNPAAPPTNQPPVANAGANQTIILPQSNITLSGSGSDPDGTIASYAWTQVSGIAATIASPSTSSTNITGLTTVGVRVFRLTVTDNQGATGTSDVTVTVNAAAPPVNQPPVANAGSNQTISLPVSGVTLSGSGTDPDGTIASYAWTQVSGTAATIASPSTASTNITGLTTVGVSVFRLTVTDNQGATATADVVITVNAASNQPPTATAGPNQTITLPTSNVTLSGSGADPDGTVASYAWTQVSGTAATITSPSAAATDITGLTTTGVRVFRLTVTDDQGATGTSDVTITVNSAANQSPTANAGSNQTITLPTSSVILSGSGTDPDGTIISYTWTQVSGTPATITSPSTAGTDITGLTTTGIRVFRLTVTDDLGATAASDITITVNATPNQSPTANAGSNQTITLPTSNVSLSGSGNDPDGTIVSYAWTQVSGTAATIASPSTASTNITGLTTVGVRVFRLTVTDNQGATGTADVAITVNAAAPPPNQSPVANAGANQTITLPQSNVTLTGSGTDPDGTIASYAWTQVSGTAATITSPSTASTTITGLTTVGVRVFRLTVTDNQGATGTADVAVTVNAAAPPPNQPPVANAGANQTITLPQSNVTLTGSGTDPDGTIASYAWTQVSGTAATITSPSTAATNISGLTTAGVRVFRLTVTDNQGATGTSDVTITVNVPANQPPVANAGANQTFTLPQSNVTLTGSGTDPDGTIVSYAWTQVSGTAATISSPSTASTIITGLTTAGIRIFRLTVTDNQGATGTSDVIITVNAASAPPNVPPVANAGFDYNITLPTNSVTLLGSGTDPDGIIAAYQWIKISGPAQFTIVSPTLAQTGINNLVEGVYQFQLTVTDNQGATNADMVVVTVNPAIRQPPTVNAGADQTITLPTYLVTVSGSATSDPNRQIASYLWTKIAGPAKFTIVNPTQAQTVIKDLVKGVYLFELKVTDNQGGIGRDTVRIEVKEESVSTARLFPNPATTLINVEINAITTTNLTDISIFDSRGVVVYQEQFIRSQQLIVKQIDIDRLPRGVYFIAVGVDIDNKRTLTFVKQ